MQRESNRGIWSCCINFFYNNVFVHQLNYHFVWTENRKFEVKAINKWIGKYMNGEMTPYERDSGELERWELLYPGWLSVTARRIAEADTNQQRRVSSAASIGHIALLNMQWLRAVLNMYFALSFSKCCFVISIYFFEQCIVQEWQHLYPSFSQSPFFTPSPDEPTEV